MTNKILKIRAHHLLCMQGFQGYGYSSDFVKNLANIVNIIRGNLDTEVLIVDSCDDICAACSKNNNDICDNFCEIDFMDKNVLNKLEIESGSLMKAKNAFDIVNLKLNSLDSVKDICGECSWAQKCIWHCKLK